MDYTVFLSAKRRFDAALTNGQRAEVRRAAKPADLSLRPGYYQVLGSQPPDEGWRRVVFMLPHAKHRNGGPRIGSILGQKANGRPRVSEMRLFQMVRAETPQDILHLRRLCRYLEPVLDWSLFGRLLYYWKDSDKQKIVEDYYIHGQPPAEHAAKTEAANA